MECDHVLTGDILSKPDALGTPDTTDTLVKPDTPELDTPELDTPATKDSSELDDLSNVPLIHVGIIPDGNRRWCKKNNKNCSDYIAMVQNLINEYKDKTRANLPYPIFNIVKEISIYVLSKDNLLKRNDHTLLLIEQTMELICTLIRIKENQEQVHFNIMGDINLLPKVIQEQINLCVSLGKGPFPINLAIGYDPIEDSKNYIEQGLDSRRPIDLVVRSGGHSRSSGFYPLQTLYSEWFYYTDLWPEITKEHIKEALTQFMSRQRNFGK
jgi:undecaprenyl diphosphate synthase